MVTHMRAHTSRTRLGCVACRQAEYIASRCDSPLRNDTLAAAEVSNEYPSAALSAEEALDQLLATIDRGLVSATELRILLRLSARDETGEELADSLAEAPSEITRASTRLDKRGLIRRR